MQREAAIGAIKWELVPYTRAVNPEHNGDRGRVLEIGAGKDKTFPHFVAITTEAYGDYPVPDLAGLGDFADELCDAVFASFCLHERPDPAAALTEWARVVMPGGWIVVHGPHEAPALTELMRGACPGGFDVLEQQEYNGALFMVFRKRGDGIVDTEAWSRAALERASIPKRICLVRYGGFGDMLQVANVLPELKRQGWHVTVMTEPRGREIIEHDPHVDAFLVQGNDQVPNGLLGPYWAHWAKKFDRFVNFSESIEGTLLAMPGRINHTWPIQVRQRHLNRNYAEWMAELAGVDFKAEGRFYPTLEEEAWARAERHAMGSSFVVLATLAGSSVHKFYRWQDEVMAGLLDQGKRARIVTVGDAACRVLEQGWEANDRVIRRSGEWSIRQTLAFARVVDAVWGPETGVLNSVANDPHLKVVMLSHSSRENLTKHWTNTATIEPMGQHCYPCHQLHYSTEFCDIDAASGTAMCQVKIAPERVLAPLMAAYADWERHTYYREPRQAPQPLLVVK